MPEEMLTSAQRPHVYIGQAPREVWASGSEAAVEQGASAEGAGAQGEDWRHSALGVAAGAALGVGLGVAAAIACRCSRAFGGPRRQMRSLGLSPPRPSVGSIGAASVGTAENGAWSC